MRPAERRPMGSSKDGRVERKQEGPGRQQGHAWLRAIAGRCQQPRRACPCVFLAVGRDRAPSGLPIGSVGRFQRAVQDGGAKWREEAVGTVNFEAFVVTGDR